MQGLALGAQTPEVGWVVRVPTHAGDLRAARLDEDAATHAAIGAGGFGQVHRFGPAIGRVRSVAWLANSVASK